MRMKTTSLAFLLLLAACGSDEDLEPNGPGPTGGEDTAPPRSGTEPPAVAALLDLAWSSTDYGQATYLSVGQLDWGPDSSLVVGSTIDDRSLSIFAPVGRIERFAADGTRLWTTELAFDEFADDLPVPPESDTVQIFGKAAHVASIDHTVEGTILVAFSVVLDYVDFEASSFITFSARSYIRSYDPDGNVLDTIALGGVTDFPVNDSVDELAGITGIRALSDGSIAWTGATSRGTHPAGSDILVTEGSVGLLSADGTPQWTVVLGQELDFPNMVAPAEEIAVDVQPTPDGGLALRGQFYGTLTIGDLSATTEREGTFVARLDLDGTPTWLATVDDSEPIGTGFAFPGMGIDSAGNLFSASHLFEDSQDRLIQVGPDGQVVGHEVELDGVESLAVARDQVIVGGNALVEIAEDEYATPGKVEVREPDGAIVASRSFATTPVLAGQSSRTFTVAASDDGRIAVGGTFNGAIDLGDGTVMIEPGVDIGAYVAVYEAPNGDDRD